MAKPTKPQWAYGDPSYIIEPSGAKKIVGWLSGEKPPFQYMNWIHFQTSEFIDYFENKTESISPTLLKSSGTLTWSGTQISFGSAIDVSFRVDLSEQINRIPSGDSPIALSDGECVVLRKDKTNPSPVTVTAGTYGSLGDAQYDIVADASLTAADQENETILFRRRGSDLEIPCLGVIYSTGQVFSLGKPLIPSQMPIVDAGGYYSGSDVEAALQEAGAAVSGSVTVPIGTILPFYDFNGALTFNTTNFKYCDGSVVTVSGIGSQTLPDLSNRYLVGFGTEGGGDIGTAAWATATVGNSGHTINIQHSHTVNSHTHTETSHTHSIPSLTVNGHTHDLGSHTHTSGTLQFEVMEFVGGSGLTPGDWTAYTSGGASVTICNGTAALGGGGNSGFDAIGITSNVQNDIYYTKTGSGSTAAASGNTGSASSSTVSNTSGSSSGVTTGSASPGTDNQLSSSQSIQPRSIRVRFIMRVS